MFYQNNKLFSNFPVLLERILLGPIEHKPQSRQLGPTRYRSRPVGMSRSHPIPIPSDRCQSSTDRKNARKTEYLLLRMINDYCAHLLSINLYNIKD